MKESIVVCSDVLICLIVLPKTRKAVLSANWKQWAFGVGGGTSAINSRYNNGDRAEPCGTPEFMNKG